MWPRQKKITADVKLINEKVCQVWLRCSPSFSSYPRKTTGGGQNGSATPERMTFERASFERTIFSDCTFERLTVGAIHRLSECHFSDYQIQRVPISTQPIWASMYSRVTGDRLSKAIIANFRDGSGGAGQPGHASQKGQNSNSSSIVLLWIWVLLKHNGLWHSFLGIL